MNIAECVPWNGGLSSSVFQMEEPSENPAIERHQIPAMCLEINAKDIIGERVRQKLYREGKPAQFPEEKQATIPVPVTPKREDPEKIRLRRERNKIAATKCRQRRRERIRRLKKQIDDLQTQQRTKTEEITKLKKTKAELERALTSHQCRLAHSLTLPTTASTSCTPPFMLEFLGNLPSNFN